MSDFLARRQSKIGASMHAWIETAQAATSSDAASTANDIGLQAVVSSYLAGTNLGDVQSVGDSSVYLERNRGGASATTVLILGSHDLGELAPGGSATTLPVAQESFHGPGVGSLFAGTCAFVEGAKATFEAGLDEAVNLRVLSVGPTDRAETCLAQVGMDGIDAIFATNSIAWDLNQPTLTTGARGRLVLQLHVDAGHAVNDAVFAGAIRNPLGRLCQVLGSLRDERGRIAIPGFYARAQVPTGEERAALSQGNYDANDWIAGMQLSRPAGNRSALERATLWPVVSVIDVSPSDTSTVTTPASATATVAFYLVPDQRPVQVEAAVREWIESELPSNLAATVSLQSMARPYRAEPTGPVAAQIAACRSVTGRAPTLIPGGGAPGAGEVTYLTGAPVAFAGLIGPAQGWGTQAEMLQWSLFERGVHLAAATCAGIGAARRAR